MSERKTPFWRTRISKVEPNKILIRGYDLASLVGRRSFAEVVYLLWKGELPTEREGKMMDALLTVGCDHSLNAPSADAVRFVASGGVPLQAAVAAGIIALGDFHGGAIEGCAKMLQDEVKRMRKEGRGADETADLILKEHKQAGKRVMGYGHPTHTEDPRTKRLFTMAQELGVAGAHTELAKAIENATPKHFGKLIIVNVDGAIAAIMSDMGFDWRYGKGFYIVGRASGLVAHAFEQIYTERPFKAPQWDEIEYNGPSERGL